MSSYQRRRFRQRARSQAVPWDLAKQVSDACDRFFKDRKIEPMKWGKIPVDTSKKVSANKESTEYTDS